MTAACETSTLAIPARSSFIEIAAAYLTAVAGQAGFAAEPSRELGQSLRVILQDIISRAFGPEDHQEIQISCEQFAFGLKVIIKEKGLPLSPDELASLAADPQTCPLVQIDNTFACVKDVWNETAFINLGRAGAEVQLVKYFEDHNTIAAAESCPVSPLAVPPDPLPGPPEIFTLRPFTPADAQAVIRLLYRTYGYSYPFEHLYYPERLIALNADGSLQSLVAVSGRDKLVGHLALFFSKENPTLAEMGAAVVDPDFRSHGCLRQLTDYALAEARRRQLSALYGRPVTNHTYSQKVSEDQGFIPCGLLLGLGPAFMSFKKIHEHLPQRESMLIIYRHLAPALPGKIFPPARHRTFILQLYVGLGFTPDPDSPPDQDLPAGPPSGALHLTTYQAAGIAIIRVKTVGSDTLSEVKRALKQLCQSRFEVIHLHLDLSQPATANLVPSCESLGFFFAGILPGLNHTQTLILQYLNNVPLDYDKIQLHSLRAQEILAYVKAADPNRL